MVNRFVIFILSFFSLVANAEVPLKEKELQEELNKLNYTQKTEVPMKESPNFRVPNINLEFLRYVFYLMAAMALIYLIYIIVKKVKFRANNVILDNKIFLGDAIPESEILRGANLEDIFNNESSAKARIRIIFLMVLQALIKKGLIDTKPSYTNGQYANFLRAKMETILFVQLVRVYEKAWFGYNETSDADVKKAMDLKTEILNKF